MNNIFSDLDCCTNPHQRAVNGIMRPPKMNGLYILLNFSNDTKPISKATLKFEIAETIMIIPQNVIPRKIFGGMIFPRNIAHHMVTANVNPTDGWNIQTVEPLNNKNNNLKNERLVGIFEARSMAAGIVNRNKIKAIRYPGCSPREFQEMNGNSIMINKQEIIARNGLGWFWIL